MKIKSIVECLQNFWPALSDIGHENQFLVFFLSGCLICLFVWFDSLHPINNLSDKQGQVFLGWTSTKLG